MGQNPVGYVYIFFPKTLFFTTKNFFCKKNFWSWKIGFWGKKCTHIQQDLWEGVKKIFPKNVFEWWKNIFCKIYSLKAIFVFFHLALKKKPFFILFREELQNLNDGLEERERRNLENEYNSVMENLRKEMDTKATRIRKVSRNFAQFYIFTQETLDSHQGR